ncbi:tetratricopeptide repeat protein [Streptomyces sp. NPDC056161]|uniref:tetratricopeptide repeat protein n=1 Tax=Streptomyces sp. NPDC056161 TaxID=3345732 RepID=UPI0035DB8730
MSRPSREDKRDERRGTGPVVPVDIRVSDAGEATVDGVPLVAPPGREIQHAVLDHLHRLALAVGHPVQAAIHDARVGYVVPLQVDTDGASSFTGDPAKLARGDVPPTSPLRPVPEPTPPGERAPASALRPVPDVVPGTVQPPTGVFGPPPVMPAGRPGTVNPPASVKPSRAAGPLRPAEPRKLTVPPRPTAPPRFAKPGPGLAGEPAGTAVPGAPAGTAVPGAPAEVRAVGAPPSVHRPPRNPLPPVTHLPVGADYDPRPTPARGFDAVAEAVLGDGDGNGNGNGNGGELLGEPTARINEAVRAGRIDQAAELAQHTVEAASADLGPDHPEVLRLRELTAYIAYLSGDPLHAFRLSFDLARLHHRAHDPEAAYGNVHSAATAWRAVRDAEQALRLGRDLIALWTELVVEEGPAADDIEELESARARMVRLTERAARAAD